MDNELFEQRKRMIYDFICDELYVPMKLKELAILMQVPKRDRAELTRVMDALVEDGKVELTKKGKYIKSEKKYETGVFTSHPKGFGFVTIEGMDEDIFIPAEQVNGAMHMDTVQLVISPTTGGKRREGTITKILSHGMNEVVGTYEDNKTFGFVVPDNPKIAKDIFIPKERSMGAVTGHKVIVAITDYGKDGKKPEGKVTEIIGHINDPGVDIMSLVKAYNIPVEFSPKIMRQVENVSNEVSEADMAGRLDLRDWQMVTIDGEDAKDLDDAITLQVTEDGLYELGVHIADVSHYVTENSALDKEALNRGTSVYLVDRVIPMIPHKLSNGICSLNAGVDRLALSCLITYDEHGKIKRHRICESVIQVTERMNYSDVRDILVYEKEETCKRYEPLIPMFRNMEKLAAILRKGRKKQGSINFDFQECKILLDKNGKPTDIVPYDRNVATRMIEEFMLAANKVVAEDYFWMDIPFLYRIHEYPDLEKIQQLSMITASLGYHIKVGKEEVHPRELQKLITSIEGTEEEAFLSRLTLRSMKRAKYSTNNEGHFGLATKYYCHFTSPIRRYPDLQIHRIIKENIRHGIQGKRYEHYNDLLPGVAISTSEKERRADDAEREVEKLKKAEYMYDHIGECYHGVISGVTSWGIYVELPNTVEGMVRISEMEDDQYEFQEERYRVVGHYTGKEYRMGQPVYIRVEQVDRELRTIDFVMMQEE